MSNVVQFNKATPVPEAPHSGFSLGDMDKYTAVWNRVVAGWRPTFGPGELRYSPLFFPDGHVEPLEEDGAMHTGNPLVFPSGEQVLEWAEDLGFPT